MSATDLLDDLPDVCREEYLYAVEVARALHDPGQDWEGFRDTLWSFLARVFGIDDAGSWPLGLPDPAAAPSGDAREVAAWIRRVGADGHRSTPTSGS